MPHFRAIQPKPPDQELAHVHTATGGDLYIKRSSAGRMRFVVRTGPTDPATNTFPSVEIDRDEFALVLEAERTFQLGCIAEALDVDGDLSIASSLATIASELNASDTGGLAHRLLALLEGKPFAGVDRAAAPESLQHVAEPAPIAEAVQRGIEAIRDIEEP